MGDFVLKALMYNVIFVLIIVRLYNVVQIQFNLLQANYAIS